MEISRINSSAVWDGWFEKNFPMTPFTQSWKWGEILIAEGKTVERLAIMEGEEVLAQAQVVYNNLFFGWRYAFCPKGPIVKNFQFPISNFQSNSNDQIYKFFLDYLKSKGIIFLRVEPFSPISNIQYPISKVVDINPRATMVLDLNKTEEELLAGMHEKTRYNIHLAERKELEIIPTASRDPAVAGKDIKLFLRLMRATGKRDKFKLHSEEHYRQILFSEMSYQLSAVVKDVVVATAVFIGFGDTFTYLYGASNYEYRQLMAPHLLQWEGIKLGKKLGYKYYDFFGIAPCVSQKSKVKSQKGDEQIHPMRRVGGCESSGTKEYSYDPRHQYAGVTRFKLGFGGATYEDPGTFDLIISPGKYKIYQILRKIRRLI